LGTTRQRFHSDRRGSPGVDLGVLALNGARDRRGVTFCPIHAGREDLGQVKTAVERGRIVRATDRRDRLRIKAPASAPVTHQSERPAGKYPFVRDRLMDILEDLSPGDSLPPERSLSETLDVSRMTLRRVLADLAREGLVTRQHGRGTFVADRRPVQRLTMTSFSEHMRAAGLRPSSRTLSFASQPAGARLGRKLKLSPADPVLRIVRLRLADDEPVAIESLHVPEALVPGLRGADLETESFYALLRGRFHVVLSEATQSIEATVTTAEESEILGVPVHSPALLFEVTAQDTTGRVVEFVRSIFRGDRYKIMAEIGDLVPTNRPNGRIRPSTAGKTSLDL
jgi:GntR family transcriptional regulator